MVQVGHSEPLQCGKTADISSRATTSTSALWDEFEGDAADWEKHEVWVSVNIKVFIIFIFCTQAHTHT